MNEFARHALANGCDLLTTDQRLALAPDDPRALTPRVVKAVTQNRMRQSLAELAHGEMDNVRHWLHEVAKDSPAKAVELFIELAQFSLPKLKETAVTMTTDNGQRTYSIEELQSIVSEQ